MQVTVDDSRPILRLLHERRVQIDPQFSGECRRLFDNAGVRINYFSKSGMTIDETSEALWDAGLTPRRLDCRETLDLLDMVFTPKKRERRPRVSRRKVLDESVRKARDMRARKYLCECGQIARGTRNSSLVCGLCFELWANGLPAEIRSYVLENARWMQRVDPTPEEVLESMAQAASQERAA